MFKKTIKTASNKCDVVGDSGCKSCQSKIGFVKNAKFTYDNKSWIIVETKYVDNTEMIKCVCTEDGTEEWLMVSTLKRDLISGKLKFN